MNQPFLLHDKARPHTILRKRKAIAKRSRLFPSSPLNPKLAPCEFHIFASIKVPLRGRRFVEDDQLKHACVKTSDTSAKSLMQPAYILSYKVVKTVLIMKHNLWKNNLNFVTNLQVACADFHLTEVTVYEKLGALFLDCCRIYSDLLSRPSIKCEMKCEPISFLNVFRMLFAHLSDYSLYYRILFMVMRYHFVLQAILIKIAALSLHFVVVFINL
jgi:hypothetical protein